MLQLLHNVMSYELLEGCRVSNSLRYSKSLIRNFSLHILMSKNAVKIQRNTEIFRVKNIKSSFKA